MKPDTDKKITITVAIPTRYGGAGLVPTVENIRASKGAEIEKLLVIADRIPIPHDIRERLEELGVSLVWNNEEGTLAKKVKQMIEMCDTDILISTQDDVLFKPDTIARIVDAFNEGEQVTMVATKIAPLPEKSFTGSIIGQAVRIPGRIASLWNRGDNYLAANGRCLSFRTQFAKKFRIPEKLVNLDAFLYFENKRLRGVMRLAEDSVAFIHAPETVQEQVRPSSRFLASQQELAPYFPYNLSHEYRIPFFAGIRAGLAEVALRPLQTICYLFVLAYTRLRRQGTQEALNPFWKIETSTKNVMDKN